MDAPNGLVTPWGDSSCAEPASLPGTTGSLPGHIGTCALANQVISTKRHIQFCLAAHVCVLNFPLSQSIRFVLLCSILDPNSLADLFKQNYSDFHQKV